MGHRRVIHFVFNKDPYKTKSHGVKSSDLGSQRIKGLFSFPERQMQRFGNPSFKNSRVSDLKFGEAPSAGKLRLTNHLIPEK